MTDEIDIIEVILLFGGIGGVIYIFVDYLFPNSGFQLAAFLTAGFLISYIQNAPSYESKSIHFIVSIILGILIGLMTASIAVAWRVYLEWNTLNTLTLESSIIIVGFAFIMGTLFAGLGGAIGGIINCTEK
jgi:hypothetical protein